MRNHYFFTKNKIASVFSLFIWFLAHLSFGQTTYYSKSAAVQFADVTSWGVNPDGSGAAPTVISNADNFIIANGSAMLLNANAAVRNLTINSGSLTVSANQLTVSLPTGNTAALNVAAGGTLTVNGATAKILINGSMSVSGTLNQSNGTIEVDGNSNIVATSVSGTIVTFESSNINLTGGLFQITDPHRGSGAAFIYNVSGQHVNTSPNHTFYFGSTTSTDQGGSATLGFRITTANSTGIFNFGNVITGGSTGTNRFTTLSNTSGILGNLTVNNGGDFRINFGTYVKGNITVNAGGTLTTTNVLFLGDYTDGSTTTPSNIAQTISGSGTFRNSITSSTASFVTLNINNSHSAGVTLSGNARLSGTNTGTVSTNLNLQQGLITVLGGPFILGTSTSVNGSLTYVSGGFASGSTFRRWGGNTPIPLTFSASAPTFPFWVDGNPRHVYLTRTGNITAGWIEATHNNASGLTNVNFTDGTYQVDKISNASWSIATGAGFALGTQTLSMVLKADGILTLNTTPGTSPRLVQATEALNTHVAATGTSFAPEVRRSGFNLPNITGQPHHVGIDENDLGLFTLASGNWENPAIWSSGTVPTDASIPSILAGHTVTVNSTAAEASQLNVLGTLTVSGSTLNVYGAPNLGVEVTNGGTINIAGGTMNVRAQAAPNTSNRRMVVNGTLNVSSGTLNVFGSFALTATSIFNQSGGEINVDGNGFTGSVPNNTVMVVFSTATPGNLNLTGGSFNILDPHPGGIATSTFRYDGSFNVAASTAHNFRLGNGVSTNNGSPSLIGFRLETSAGFGRFRFGNLEVNTVGGNNRFVTCLNNLDIVQVEGNFTLATSLSEWRHPNLSVAGNIVNNGILTLGGTLSFAAGEGIDGRIASTNAQTVSGTGIFRNDVNAPTGSVVNLYLNNTSASGVTLNVPLEVTGLINLINGKINTTATNILRSLSTTSGQISPGTTTAGYVSGPFERFIPANKAFNTFNAILPVGKTGPNWISFNPSTSAGGPVVIRAEVFDANSGTTGPTLTSLNNGRRWETSITSGAANLTSYAATIYDNAVAAGNVVAGSNAPSGAYNTIGLSGNFSGAIAPLPATLTMTTADPLPPNDFPASIGFGVPGPLTLLNVNPQQITGSVTTSSTNNNLLRLALSAAGTSGTITLNQLVFTYTGTNAADVTSVSLWSGTDVAPVTSLGSTTLSGGQATFTGLTQNVPSGLSYLWIRVNISGSAATGNIIDGLIAVGDMTFSSSGGAIVTPPVPDVTLDPSGNRVVDYCAALQSNGCGITGADAITNVTLSTLNNSSACTPIPSYVFYNALTPPQLIVGTNYTLSVTMGSDASQFSAVWIDFNKDGIFQASEYFSTGTNAGAFGTSNITISVPLSAVAGITRMRVRGGVDNVITSGQACTTFSWGETEDYLVDIVSVLPKSVADITIQQVTGGVTRNSTNNNLLRLNIIVGGADGTLTLNSVRMTYTGTNSADIAANGFSIWSGTITGPVTQIGSNVSLLGGAALFSAMATDLAPGNNYLWIRTDIASGATIGNIVDGKIEVGDIVISAAGGALPPGTQPPVELDPSGNRFVDYCLPIYTTGCSSGDRITNVTLQSINNTTGTGCSVAPNPLGYIFFAPGVNTTTDLIAGASYTASVTIGPGGAAGIAAWIDYNQNGVFDASEKIATVTTIAANSTANLTIEVPSDATFGATRLRIRTVRTLPGTDIEPCDPYALGEAEDYVVNIIPPPNCVDVTFPGSANITATAVTVCSGTSITFGVTPAMPAATGITYQLRRNGINVGAPISTPSNTIAVSQSGNYDIRILCNGNPVLTTSSVAITALTQSITSSTPATRCGTGTVTLVANGSTGSTVRWFSSATGGMAISTGTNFVTPILSSTTTYYASARQVFGTENGGLPANTSSTGALALNHGIVFTATANLSLNSTTIYPYGTGDIIIALQNASGVELMSTPNIPITAANGNPIVVPLNFDVAPGVGYRLVVKTFTGITDLIRENSGVVYPYNSPSGALSVTAGFNGANTASFYYYFYNLEVSRQCVSSPRVAITATVNAAPPITLTPAAADICAGQTVNVSASGSGYTSYTWSPPATVLPAGPGATKTLNPVVTTSYAVTGTGGGCTNTAFITVNVRPTPTNPIITPTPASGICFGNPLNLQVASSAGGDLVILNTTFNNHTLQGWTVANGGTNPASFFVRSTPYTTPSIQNFSVSNPATPFLVVNSDALGAGANGFATAVSPSFSTLGLSAASLRFSHVYRGKSATRTGTVQYSTDNGLTWSSNIYNTGSSLTVPLQTWDESNISVVNTTISLPAGALNQPTVRIRFKYDHAADWYWMIDDIQITTPATQSYRWTQNSPFGGLTPAQQNFLAANQNVNITAAEGGSYAYTVTVQNSAGCNAVATATHNVNISQILIAAGNTGPQRVGTTLTISTPPATGGFGVYSYQWRKLPNLTVINTNNSFSVPNAQISESGTYQLTVTDGQGCSVTGNTDVLIFAALVWNGSSSNNWYDAQNWTPPLVPADDCDENVVITNNGFAPVLNGPAISVGNFGLENNSNITLNTDLRVCGSFTGGAIGASTVTGSGSVELTSGGTVFVAGNTEFERLTINKSAGSTVRVTGRALIKNLMSIANSNANVVIEPSGRVILQSTSSQTAKVGPIPAGTSITLNGTGRFVAERWLPFANNLGQWFFLGSPIQGKDFRDWADDFRIAGGPGSFSTQGGGMITYGSNDHTTIFKQVESQYKGRLDTVQKRGWRIPGASEIIETGKGYRVWIRRNGNNGNGKFNNQGLINYGTIVMPQLTSTLEAPCSNSTSDWCWEEDRGFNFVANPYPCDIDWEATPAAWPRPATMENTYYRWSYNGYGNYTSGGAWTGVLPAPANPRYIPSSQAFFVRLNPTGASFTENWSITENAKSTTNAGAFARVSTSGVSQLKISMHKTEAENDYGFQTILQLSASASDAYVFNEDVVSLGSSRFNHYMKSSDGKALALNTIAVPSDIKIIPLFTQYAGENGIYQLKFIPDAPFGENVQVYLRDKYLNQLQPIISEFIYTYHVASTDGSSDIERFELVLVPNEVVANKVNLQSSIGLTIFPNPGNAGKEVQIQANGLNGSMAYLEVTDILGKLLYQTSTAVGNQKQVSFNYRIDLPVGVYIIKIGDGNTVLSKKLIVR
jgi:hypothetical protein